ncbi:MAG: NYN domain-containing protein [Peptoniphilus harei]|nr:NYN domain-containing protein [Peptoniphilus harei]MDU3010766.1 NYN domain-containing protein [Peptoniphilus harei]MDU5571094.1 NYN domain-containing protein [Peptoniphilus harei]MDU7115754.1 NYN domain-containing protein [Peptoniphilus harei]
MKTAILVDGAYYRKINASVFGMQTPKETVDAMYKYCLRHLKDKKDGDTVYNELYRIFYYDCPPISTNIFHPYLQRDVNLGKSDLYKWMTELINELKKQRKVALRLGTLSDYDLNYNLKFSATKKLFNHSLTVSELQESDFQLNIRQKGVDMKIGIDIASLAYKKQVDQIVLIAGDSDFVPAAKLARREGIDFVLDPLGRKIKDDLFEHIDGLKSRDDKYYNIYRKSNKISEKNS